LSPSKNRRHYYQDNELKKQKEGFSMYGLAEYALLRQQLNESKMKKHHHPEFDFPITQPAPKQGSRRLTNVRNYLSRKIGVTRKIK
jgi:hypothetical protein